MTEIAKASWKNKRKEEKRENIVLKTVNATRMEKNKVTVGKTRAD